ncbi:MAG: histidine kinase [Nevskia sp.]|jgi:two-component system, LytTR family, sensor histidine kinase AlgZ|nr:histidine kinase [Nevskia sp.]
MKRYEVAAISETSLIPEFCRAPALITLAYVMELIAVILTLASTSTRVDAQYKLLVLSLYLQLLGLCGAGTLCLARRWLRSVRLPVLFFSCWGLLVLVTATISWSAWTLNGLLNLPVALGGSQWSFILRNVLIAAIVSLLLLRYLWERHQWQEESRAETEARYLALQARIRPHFLFNSLNSLAELISTQPETAENMVVDLADLFRASLDSRHRLIPLREEIEIVKGYLRIEEIRLGDKLLVNWEIAESALDAQVPRLTLQPLVENAILHGISRLNGRGLLHIIARREGDYLVADVENPLPPEEAPKRVGTGTAINNIAQRIKLIYGDRAKLILGEERDEFGPLFRARLRLPFVLHSGAALSAPIALEDAP